jgi:hypothetical protein
MSFEEMQQIMSEPGGLLRLAAEGLLAPHRWRGSMLGVNALIDRMEKDPTYRPALIDTGEYLPDMEEIALRMRARLAPADAGTEA